MDSSMLLTSSETCSLRLEAVRQSGVAGWVAVLAVVIVSLLRLMYVNILKQKKGYTSSRKAFSASRRFFSLRRYHIHCPIFSDSTSPALVRTFIWWEMVGCERSTLASMSHAHIPTDFSMEQQPFSFKSERMRRRVGSAMADKTVLSSVSIDSNQYTNGIDGCQYISVTRSVGRI